MRVAVTGGAGLLGTPILRRLLAEDAVTELRCLDLRPPAVPLGRVTYRRADVRDPELVRHLDGIDAVVHLAALVTAFVPRAVIDAVNVGGTRNVAGAAAAAGVKQLLYTSSLAAYGLLPGHRLPIVEDNPRRRDPVLPYAQTKFDVEAFLDGFEAEHPDLAVVRFRPGIVLGARMENPLGSAMRFGFLPDVRVPMPAVWDEDVADAVAAALLRGARGPFNLAAQDPVRAQAVARATGLRLVAAPTVLLDLLGRAGALAARLGGRPPADPAWLRVLPDADMTASSARAERELGWTPRCPTSVSVFQRFIDEVPRALDPRLKVFFAIAPRAGRVAPGVAGDVHLALAGPRGGDVALRVEGDRLRARPGVVPRPPAAVVTLDAGRFLEVIAGGGELAAAGARVEGDAAAAGLVTALVDNARARLGRWMPAIVSTSSTR